MKRIYYVTTLGPWGDAQSSQLCAYLHEKLPEQPGMMKLLWRLVEAEVILKYTYIWFLDHELEWHKRLQETAEKIPKAQTPVGYEEAWCADSGEARGALLKVEILLPALLNHFYIVHQHLLSLTRELAFTLDIALVPSMSKEQWESGRWQRHLSRCLAREYKRDLTGKDVQFYIKLLMVRRIRVHEDHLFAHHIANGIRDTGFTWQGHIWEERSKVSLTSSEIKSGLADLQEFLAWYIKRVKDLLGPRRGY